MLDAFQPLINQGVHETDPAKRSEIYKQFNKLYYEDIPTFLLANSTSRHYEQRWVKGYYYNPLYGSGPYFYALSKD